jgi:uncharacterized protein (TIGR02996 family)
MGYGEADDSSEVGELVLELAANSSPTATTDLGQAAAVGEVLDGWQGLFFDCDLGQLRRKWRLHAVLVGRRIVLRAGFCGDDDGEESQGAEGIDRNFDEKTVNEVIEADEEQEVEETELDEDEEGFVNGPNQVWVHVFREDLDGDVILLRDAGDVLIAQLELEGAAWCGLSPEALNERDALLSGIIANPDDVTKRRVFADWLDEKGQTARAELIRLQIAADEAPGEHRADIQGQAQKLIAAHEQEWAPASEFGSLTWRLGFVEGFATHVDYLGDAELLFVQHPVRDLECDLHDPLSFGFSRLDTILGFRHAMKLRSLCLRVESLSPEAAMGIAQCRALRGLTNLTILADKPVPEAATRVLIERFADRVSFQHSLGESNPTGPDQDSSSPSTLLDLL